MEKRGKRRNLIFFRHSIEADVETRLLIAHGRFSTAPVRMCALSVYLQLLIAIYSSPIYFCRSSALWSWTDSKICDSGIELTRKFGTDCWRLLELNRKSWTDSRSSHGLLVLELKREAPDERGTSRKELDAEWNAHAACLRGAAPCYLLPLPY
jgi:hypothetical protein